MPSDVFSWINQKKTTIVDKINKISTEAPALDEDIKTYQTPVLKHIDMTLNIY